MDKILFSITEQELKTLLEVKYCTAKDNTRPVLTRVCFNSFNGQFEVCALDGYRLSKRTLEIQINNDFNFVLNHESIQNLYKIAKKNSHIVNVYLANDYVEFNFTEQNKIVKCILKEEDYIKYNSIIPEGRGDLELKINSKNVLEAIKSLKKESKRLINNNIAKLFIQNDNLVITAQPIKKEYSEVESIKLQEKRQKDYDNKYKIKYNKWLEKVERAKEKGKTIKAKEPVNKTAKFQKIYTTTKLDEVKIDIPCKIKRNKLNNDFKIGLNINYIYEAIKLYKDEVIFKFNSPVSPCIITQNNKSLEMILPIRLLNSY